MSHLRSVELPRFRPHCSGASTDPSSGQMHGAPSDPSLISFKRRDLSVAHSGPGTSLGEYVASLRSGSTHTDTGLVEVEFMRWTDAKGYEMGRSVGYTASQRGHTQQQQKMQSDRSASPMCGFVPLHTLLEDRSSSPTESGSAWTTSSPSGGSTLPTEGAQVGKLKMLSESSTSEKTSNFQTTSTVHKPGAGPLSRTWAAPPPADHPDLSSSQHRQQQMQKAGGKELAAALRGRLALSRKYDQKRRPGCVLC
eukprot:TRINITY_DN9289_c0_g1_i1.p1 TRINITY_DN9289_c0_g1~~TRINITY_DN9289_c0_g1_i1.p1  ORF type:complete len:252 (+),score=22.35 TRINITY_DN9289_c0_g1_i1:84-839(+)